MHAVYVRVISSVKCTHARESSDREEWRLGERESLISDRRPEAAQAPVRK